MGTILMLGVILTTIYVVLDIFIKIPGAHYGVHLRFGKRTGSIMEEGLHFKLPFTDQVELFSTELEAINVEVNFTTVDKLQLTLKGSLQQRADSRISDDPKDLDRPALERLGKNIFYAMSDDIIQHGIESALKSLLGGLGGVYAGEEFVKNRQALSQMVNAILRLKEPPHLHHKAAECGVSGCALPERVDAKDLITYYNKHWREVRAEVAAESERVHECSPIELLYGIDISTFALADVDFTEATKKAFEKKKQAEASKEAFASKLDMAEDAQKRLGASAQEALNAADVSLDSDIKKSVISVEGEGGVLGGFLGKLGGIK